MARRPILTPLAAATLAAEWDALDAKPIRGDALVFPLTYWQVRGGWERARVVAGFPSLRLGGFRGDAARHRSR